MTKEDVEDASGEGKQECWFGEGNSETFTLVAIHNNNEKARNRLTTTN